MLSIMMLLLGQRQEISRAFDYISYFAIVAQHVSFLLPCAGNYAAHAFLLGFPLLAWAVAAALHYHAIKTQKFYKSASAAFAVLHFCLVSTELALVHFCSAIFADAVWWSKLLIAIEYAARYLLQVVCLAAFTPYFVVGLRAMPTRPKQLYLIFFWNQIFYVCMVLVRRGALRLFFLCAYMFYAPSMVRYVQMTYYMAFLAALSINAVFQARICSWCTSCWLSCVIFSVNAWRHYNTTMQHRSALIYRELFYQSFFDKSVLNQESEELDRLFYALENMQLEPQLKFYPGSAVNHRLLQFWCFFLHSGVAWPFSMLLACVTAPRYGNDRIQLPARGKAAGAALEQLLYRNESVWHSYYRRCECSDSLLDYYILWQYLRRVMHVRKLIIAQISALNTRLSDKPDISKFQQQFHEHFFANTHVNDTLISMLKSSHFPRHEIAFLEAVAEPHDLYGYIAVQLLVLSQTEPVQFYDSAFQKLFPCLNIKKTNVFKIAREIPLAQKIGDFLCSKTLYFQSGRTGLYTSYNDDFHCYFPRLYDAQERMICIYQRQVLNLSYENQEIVFSQFQSQYKQHLSQILKNQQLPVDSFSYAIRPEGHIYRIIYNLSYSTKEIQIYSHKIKSPMDVGTITQAHIIGQDISVLSCYNLCLLHEMILYTQGVQSSKIQDIDAYVGKVVKLYDQFASSVMGFLTANFQIDQLGFYILALSSVRKVCISFFNSLYYTAQQYQNPFYKHIFRSLSKIFYFGHFGFKVQRFERLSRHHQISSDSDGALSSKTTVLHDDHEFLYQNELGRYMNKIMFYEARTVEDRKSRKIVSIAIYTFQICLIILPTALFHGYLSELRRYYRNQFDAVRYHQTIYDQSLYLLENQLYVRFENIYFMKKRQAALIEDQGKHPRNSGIGSIVTYTLNDSKYYALLQFGYYHLQQELVVAWFNNFESEDVRRPFLNNIVFDPGNFQLLEHQYIWFYYYNNYIYARLYDFVYGLCFSAVAALLMSTDYFALYYFLSKLREKLSKRAYVSYFEGLLQKLRAVYSKYFRLSKEGTSGASIDVQFSRVKELDSKRVVARILDFFPVLLIFCNYNTIDRVQRQQFQSHRQLKPHVSISQFLLLMVTMPLIVHSAYFYIINTYNLEERTQLHLLNNKEEVVFQYSLRLMTMEADEVIFCNECNYEVHGIDTDYFLYIQPFGLEDIISHCEKGAGTIYFAGTMLYCENAFQRNDNNQFYYKTLVYAISYLQRQIQIAWSLHQMQFMTSGAPTNLYSYTSLSFNDGPILASAAAECEGIQGESLEHDFNALLPEQYLALSRCILKSAMYRANLQKLLEYFQSYKLGHNLLVTRCKAQQRALATWLGIIVFLILFSIAVVGYSFKVQTQKDIINLTLYLKLLALGFCALLLLLIWLFLCLQSMLKIIRQQTDTYLTAKQVQLEDNYVFQAWLNKKNYGSFSLLAQENVPLSPFAQQLISHAAEYEALMKNNFLTNDGIPLYRRMLFDIVKAHNNFISASKDPTSAFNKLSGNAVISFYDAIISELPAMQRKFNSLPDVFLLRNILTPVHMLFSCGVLVFFALYVLNYGLLVICCNQGGKCHECVLSYKLEQLGRSVVNAKGAMKVELDPYFNNNSNPTLKKKMAIAVLPISALFILMSAAHLAVVFMPISRTVQFEQVKIADSLRRSAIYEIERIEGLYKNTQTVIIAQISRNCRRTLAQLLQMLYSITTVTALGSKRAMQYGTYYGVGYNQTFSAAILESLQEYCMFPTKFSANHQSFPMFYTPHVAKSAIFDAFGTKMLELQYVEKDIAEAKRILASMDFSTLLQDNSGTWITCLHIFIACAAVIALCCLGVKFAYGISGYIRSVDGVADMVKNARGDAST